MSKDKNTLYWEAEELHSIVAGMYHVMGGTNSSTFLRNALELETAIEQIQANGNGERLSRLEALTLVAATIRFSQKGIERHNRQLDRISSAYDVNTGEIVDDVPDYEKNLEAVQS